MGVGNGICASPLLMLHVNGKFTVGKLKSSLLFSVLWTIICFFVLLYYLSFASLFVASHYPLISSNFSGNIQKRLIFLIDINVHN
jgi:hypothetical protein